MPEFAPDKRRPVRSSFTAETLKNSGIQTEVRQDAVLWTMAKTGNLASPYQGPPVNEKISHDGIVLQFTPFGTLKVSLRLNNALRDSMAGVDFGSRDFRRVLAHELGRGAVSIDPQTRTIEISQRAENETPYSAKATWPPPNGDVYDRVFQYEISEDLVRTKDQFAQELKQALKLLQAYLVYGLLKGGREIPTATLVIQPPVEFAQQASRQGGKAKALTPASGAKETDLVAYDDAFELRRPQVSLDDIDGIPTLRKELRRIAACFAGNERSGLLQDLGLPERALVVIHGDEIGMRTKVAAGFAAELGAGLCTVNPYLGIPDGVLLLEDALKFWDSQKKGFLSGLLVLQLLEVEDGEPSEDGKLLSPSSRLSIDPIYTVLDRHSAWESTILIVSVPSLQSAHPSVRERASAILCTDFAVDGVAEILEKTMQRITGRAHGALRFNVDCERTAEILWNEGCQTRGDIVDTVEEAVRLRAQGCSREPKAIDAPFTGGSLGAAWDFIKERRQRLDG